MASFRSDAEIDWSRARALYRGMTSADLLWACRELAARLELVGADVVEVIPSAPLAATDVTASVAARIAHELLAGLALHRG